MLKSILLTLLIAFITYKSAWTQNQITYPLGNMEHQADSVSLFIDSLILSQKLFHVVFENKCKGDTATYYRQYYIDTVNHYLVKCIIDTTFIDHYKSTFKQVVIYFNQGYEFKNCYNSKLGIASKNCTLHNIYPEGYEIAQQPGKLDENWTQEALDEKMRYYVARDIFETKFLQKKHSRYE